MYYLKQLANASLGPAEWKSLNFLAMFNLYLNLLNILTKFINIIIHVIKKLKLGDLLRWKRK